MIGTVDISFRKKRYTVPANVSPARQTIVTVPPGSPQQPLQSAALPFIGGIGAGMMVMGGGYVLRHYYGVN